ncbi:MAG: hypothetical protein ACRDOJ_09825 [Nocardioidaceae bacterium]
MANTVYLHVGTPKSGTTYLQAVLSANKARLADEARLLYPGRTWGQQVRAVRDILDAHPHGDHDPAVEGAWQHLVDEMAGWDGDALVSMEWLGSAGPRKAPRIVESLHPARVEVIVTVRDLARTIPAAWQEFVQNWNAWSWEEFVAAVSAENPKATAAGRLFWVQQDLGRMFAVWRDVLPAGQVHLVTLPQPGAPASELWNRFASVLGVDPRRFDTTGRGGNESLGLESTELMLRLNRASRLSNVSWDVYNEAFKGTLAKRGLSLRKPRESAVALPESAYAWVKATAAEQVATVQASGVHVVGDLADLEPRLRSPGVQPAALATEALLDAALDGLVFLGENRTKEIARLRAANADLRKQVKGQRTRLDKQQKRIDAMRRRLETRPGSPAVDTAAKRAWSTRARGLVRRGRSVVRGGRS